MSIIISQIGTTTDTASTSDGITAVELIRHPVEDGYVSEVEIRVIGGARESDGYYGASSTVKLQAQNLDHAGVQLMGRPIEVVSFVNGSSNELKTAVLSFEVETNDVVAYITGVENFTIDWSALLTYNQVEIS